MRSVRIGLKNQVDILFVKFRTNVLYPLTIQFHICEPFARHLPVKLLDSDVYQFCFRGLELIPASKAEQNKCEFGKDLAQLVEQGL